MSKISEQKALEAYPIKEKWVGNQYGGLEDINSLSREKYQEGYGQAMQDFLEKTEDAISMISRHYVGEDYFFDQIWEQFKNYMQNEIQD